jgi:hypothetical protein
MEPPGTYRKKISAFCNWGNRQQARRVSGCLFALFRRMSATSARGITSPTMHVASERGSGTAWGQALQEQAHVVRC